MNIIPVLKLATKTAASWGVTSVITQGIIAIKPEAMTKLQKVGFGIGTFTITYFVANKVDQLVQAEFDEFSQLVEDLKDIRQAAKQAVAEIPDISSL